MDYFYDGWIHFLEQLQYSIVVPLQSWEEPGYYLIFNTNFVLLK